MKITRSQLRRLIEQEIVEAPKKKVKKARKAAMHEDVGSGVSLDVLKSVEQKFREILHELPKDFGAMALVVSAAKAIVNARKAAEGSHAV